MGRWMMGLLAISLLVGCNRFSGPLETRRLERPDAPSPDGIPYSIYEQQKRGRERLAISEDDFRIGPKGYIDRPSPIGR
jgi:hypothetical protein